MIMRPHPCSNAIYGNNLVTYDSFSMPSPQWIANSLAVEGLDPEKIGIEIILVPKEAEFFVEQHIQSPPKLLGEKLLALFAFLI